MDTATGNTIHRVVLHDETRKRWLLFRNPIRLLEVTSLEDVIPTLQFVEQQVMQQKRFAAGFISYEASSAFDAAFCTRIPDTNFPLLWFGLYSEPEEINLPEPDFKTYSLGDPIPSVNKGEYNRAISRIKEHIRSGNTYQVNYTMQMDTPFSGDPWNLFLAMVRAQSPGYAAWIDTGRFAICSASPELFFKLDKDRLTCKPMKGTVRRGRTYQEDESLSEWLSKSEKNRAENLMIVDMVRNDLGRVAEAGSVSVNRLFEVQKHPTLWQMTSTIVARSSKSFSDILSAIFPCASITGAPKVRTTRIIAELEKTPRNIYTGCIGYLAPGPTAQFNVAIRTAVVDRINGVATYNTGGGIVWDSSSEDEYTEALLKTRVLKVQKPEFSLLETILWTENEGYFLLDRHLKRLTDSAAYFEFPLDVDAVRGVLAQESFRFSRKSYRVRLLVGRSGSIQTESTVFFPEESLQDTRVGIAKTPVRSKDIFLFHKTTIRNVYDEALKSFPDCGDVLLWNENGELTESTIANIVLDINGELYTPPVSSGLLPGVFRSSLIDQGVIHERILKVPDLARCDTIFLINSVRKWRKAVLVENNGSTDKQN
ncbi:MAG: aminodeoxychorismate synthase component I [Acidobacteriota bacterium]